MTEVRRRGWQVCLRPSLLRFNPFVHHDDGPQVHAPANLSHNFVDSLLFITLSEARASVCAHARV